MRNSTRRALGPKNLELKLKKILKYSINQMKLKKQYQNFKTGLKIEKKETFGT